MKKIILLLVSMFFILTTSSQDLKQNLQKYWYYRNRLKNFVKVSDNENEALNEAGTNIPAKYLYKESTITYMYWDDGNVIMNEYISVLATEYRLLKNYNQDYSQTIKELYYALLSFIRLDAYGEYYYRHPNEKYDTDLNGFFVRDDITKSFREKYKKGGTFNNNLGYFKAEEIPQALNPEDPTDCRNYEKSEDNVWHYLEALSLVNKLVDDEVVDGSLRHFKQMAKDITDRIVGHLHNSQTIYGSLSNDIDIPLPFHFEWYNKNPITNNLVKEGNGVTNKEGGFDGTMLWQSYGFAESANQILGVKNQYKGMSEQSLFFDIKNVALKLPDSESLFKDFLSAPVIDIDLSVTFNLFACPDVLNPLNPSHTIPFLNSYLSLDGVEYNKVIDNVIKISESLTNPCVRVYHEKYKLTNLIYDDYKIRSACAVGNIHLNSNEPDEPYQILISKQKSNQIFKYQHLPLLWCILNDCVTCITQEDRDNILGHLNSAPVCGPFFPNEANKNKNEWSVNSYLISPEDKLVVGKYKDGTEFNGLDYMLLHNLYWLTNPIEVSKNLNPMQIGLFGILIPYISYTKVVTNDIVSSQSLDLNNNTICVYAGNSITLQPGFETTGTGNVYFNISEVTTTNEPIYFHKISLSGYDACPDRLK